MRGLVRFQRGRRVRRQRGQMLVETAIIMPIMIFVILGALQLVMMQHAKVMTEYAAYNAARAGIVHNANWNVMRNAALVAALPIYKRTDSLGRFMLAWGELKLVNEALELVDTATGTIEHVADDLLGMVGIGNLLSNFLPDLSLVDVDVTSPVASDFEDGRNWQGARESHAQSVDGSVGELNYPEKEMDFDDREMIREHPRLGRLAVEVRVLVPLKIPLVNWIFFQLWFAQEELRLAALRSSLQDWAELKARVVGGGDSGKSLEQVVQESAGEQEVLDDAFLTTQRTKEARALRDLALARNIYLIPMRATYAMQMQSNPFWENRRQPVWFSLTD